MKKLVISLFTGIVALTTIQNTKADVIANWTFESSGLGSSTPSFAPGAATATTNFYAELGAQAGTATVFGLHTAAATYTSPVGNGSAKSLSSTAWQTGSDYFQFSVSTVSGGDYYTNITIAYDQTGSGTGPRDFAFQYSLDGSSFSMFGSSYVVLTNNVSANNELSGFTTAAWTSSSTQSAFTHSFDLSSLTSLANISTIYFRIANIDTTSETGGTTASTGTDRIDNLIVSGTLISVPEPSTLALAAFGGVAALLAFRRRH